MMGPLTGSFLHLGDIVPPTLAVVAAWLWLGAFVGCVGHATRLAALRVAGIDSRARPTPVDLWIGLAALVACLQVWNLAAPITGATWIAPAVAAVAGLILGARSLRGVVKPTISWGVVAGTALAGLWLANRSLAAAFYYDLGLYHFAAIEYASHFAAVPGLGNLHGRLGADNGHLLLVAFVDRGPLTAFGYHVVNGLLAAMLLVDIAWRFVRRPLASRLSSFTARLALFLLPATLVATAGGKGSRLNNPDLDFAVFVLVVIGTLYFVECVEFGFETTPAIASVSSIALASTTRPYYWPFAAFTVGVLAWSFWRTSATRRPQASRGAVAVLLLPLLLAVGWAARQAVLSGYPFFPSTTFGLPVDWRMPAASVQILNRFVSSWARSPGDNPDVVLASWHWLGPWLNRHLGDVDLVGPVLLLACVPAALLSRSKTEASDRRARRTAMLAITLAAVPLLVLWFLEAPDPRFAMALLWLLPIALLAWLLPGERPGRGSRTSVTLTYTCVAAALLAVIGLVAHKGVYRPIVSNGDGPLGTEAVPIPSVVPYVTRSGLRIYRPASGELCWRTLLCTPRPNASLRARGSSMGVGFAISR
jgi:hypothetical protein